jgi:hypothetical protein
LYSARLGTQSEGFAVQLVLGSVAATELQCVLGLAADEQAIQRWAQLACMFGNLMAVHAARQTDMGNLQTGTCAGEQS